jgi:hypothetical protein
MIVSKTMEPLLVCAVMALRHGMLEPGRANELHRIRLPNGKMIGVGHKVRFDLPLAERAK